MQILHNPENFRPHVVSWERSIAGSGNLEIGRITMKLGKKGKGLICQPY